MKLIILCICIASIPSAIHSMRPPQHYERAVCIVNHVKPSPTPPTHAIHSHASASASAPSQTFKRQIDATQKEVLSASIRNLLEKHTELYLTVMSFMHLKNRKIPVDFSCVKPQIIKDANSVTEAFNTHRTAVRSIIKKDCPIIQFQTFFLQHDVWGLQEGTFEERDIDWLWNHFCVGGFMGFLHLIGRDHKTILDHYMKKLEE